MGPQYQNLKLDEMLQVMAWVRHLYKDDVSHAPWFTEAQKKTTSPTNRARRSRECTWNVCDGRGEVIRRALIERGRSPLTNIGGNEMRHCKIGFALLAAICVTPIASALAYDGTNCKAPGNCWEPKPGFPDKIAGSKYDPKHDPKELAKQQASVEPWNNATRSASLISRRPADGSTRSTRFPPNRTPSP